MTVRCLAVFMISVILVATDLNAQAPEGEIKSGSIQLFDSSQSDNYEKATFSFALGIRDDPTSATRNDWDLLYSGSRFGVRMVVDDRSVIVDLGDVEFADLKELPAIPKWSAEKHKHAIPFVGRNHNHVPAIVGHTYLVHTKDSNSDYVSLFRVKKMEAGKTCSIDWIHWMPNPVSEPLELSDQTKDRLSGLLHNIVLDKRSAERKRVGLVEPTKGIVMQIKTGARGGNPARLNMKGETYRLDEAASSDELNFVVLPNIRDEDRHHLKGGYIPQGKALVITSIDVFGSAAGDSNGHGEAILKVG